VHIFTNTWIFNDSKNSSAWVGNPHPDIKPSGDFSSISVSGCTLFVGRGVEIIERSETGTRQSRAHGNMLAVPPFKLYDFVQKYELNFDDCEK